MPDADSVFSDTSVLFDYALGQDDGSAKRLLQNHPASKVISTTVRQEFVDVSTRRGEILKSIYSTDDLDDWEPPRSVQMYSNDVGWCASLLAELSSLSSRQAIERRLDLEERKINAARDTLFNDQTGWIDHIWSGNISASLSGNLRIIDNKKDKQIVGEAATWANGTEKPFVTSDNDDLLSQKEDIEDAIDMDRTCGELELMTKDEFLS